MVGPGAAAHGSAVALKAALQARALEEGFVAMGVCRPDAVPDVPARLADAIARGWHGQMGWLATRMAWRGDPGALWPACRSVVVLAESYAPETDPLDALAKAERGAISVYAQGADYHKLVKQRLKRLGRWFLDQVDTGQGGPPAIKVFVDTAPVSEKALAQAAGLGWQGKHTNLLSRDFGNWVFLGVLMTTVALPPDPPEEERCGTCTRCLDVCPTDAFPAPFRLDARRCISYLTIEHRGPVPEDLRPGLGNRIYGCDDCLAVCPWNKFAVQASDLRYSAREAVRDLSLCTLAGLGEEGFRTRFAGTAIKRIGWPRFLRNVLYAIGNSGCSDLRGAARPHQSSSDLAVADAARWALARL